MSDVTPIKVLQQVSEAVPTDCRRHIVVIGSLAAGYHFFRDQPGRAVRTKDVDCMLSPFEVAVSAGKTIVEKLLDAGWQRRKKGDHQEPGNADTPDDKLPAVRLYPPGVDPDSEAAWFIEFLTTPESVSAEGRQWTRLELPQGHFGLPSFRFLALAGHAPLTARDLGIRYARPEMMALANLLEHPEIKSDSMSGKIGGREIKRANKDLGRVIALATLADLDDYEAWGDSWREALESCFPDDCRTLAARAGNGLRALLASPNDFEQAHHTCVNGLLSYQPPTGEALRIAAQRLLQEAVEPLETWGKSL